jgi:hypothetical protein
LAGCELNLHFDVSVRLTYHLSAKIEKTLLELRKCIEGVEGIEARKNAPSGFAACWKKDLFWPTHELSHSRIRALPFIIVYVIYKYKVL